jgi:O-antigen ligase
MSKILKLFDNNIGQSGNNRNYLITAAIQVNAFLIPISSFASIRMLILTLVALQLMSFSSGKTLRNGWDIFAYLTLLLLGLTYTQDMKSAIKVLETSFSMIAIPFIIAKVPEMNSTKRDAIFDWFTYGVLITSLICLVHALLRFLQTGSLDSFFYYNLTEFLNFQPTYFAYYLIFSVSYIFYQIFYGTRTHIVYVIIFLILFVTLILTGGQTAFICLLLAFAFFLLKFITDESSRSRGAFLHMTIYFVCLVIMLVSTLLLDDKLYQVDSWERFELWRAGLMATTNPIFGVGTGDTTSALNAYYYSSGLNLYAAENYNSHNQYIQLYLANGVAGLLVVLILVFRPIYVAYINKDVFGILFLFPFIIYGVTEVFLGRYQGIVFFTFLHQILVHYYYSLNSSIVLLEKKS